MLNTKWSTLTVEKGGKTFGDETYIILESYNFLMTQLLINGFIILQALFNYPTQNSKPVKACKLSLGHFS